MLNGDTYFDTGVIMYHFRKLHMPENEKNYFILRYMAHEIITKHSPNQRHCILQEHLSLKLHWHNDEYGIFTVEARHILQLEISNRVMKCFSLIDFLLEKQIAEIKLLECPEKSSCKVNFMKKPDSLFTRHKRKFIILEN